MSVSVTTHPQRDVQVGGVRIRYIDVGPREGTPLVILPGHTSRIEEYDPIVPGLARSFRVIVLDFPGSGYSEKPVWDYDVTTYEDVLVAFLDALGIERADLAGGSLGANVAFGVAARHPERVRRLAVWSPGSAWERSPWIAGAGRLLLRGWLLFWPSVRIQSRFWLDEDDPSTADALAETFRYYDEVMGPGFVAMYWGIALDSTDRSLFDVAPHVAQPVLLIWGTGDRTPGMADGVERICRMARDCRLKGFDGAPHSLVGVVTEDLVREIRSFLAG